jgi:membrane protease YdiL (CAAX protease family)
VSALFPPGPLTGSVALLLGAVAAGTLLLVMDDRPPGAMGFFVHPRAVTESALGLALGTAVALAVVVALVAAGGLRWTADEGSALDWFVAGLGALGFLALPAAAEEALLRGYPLQALTERWGPWSALAVTSVLFGALHLGNPGVTMIAVLNVMAAGVFLGVVYLRTASLWWATGVHLAWNWTTGYVADVPVSGLELLDAPLYEGVTRGPAWVGGGAFGPEGSLVATLLLVVATAWCWKTTWLRPSATALRARPLAVIGGMAA